jgi:predicted metalloprotease with PDZ domain
LTDARDRLAEVANDRAFADQFFDKYIEGRDVPDFAALLSRAGLVVRKRHEGAAWTGATIDAAGKVTALVDWGTPAFAAGLEKDDVVLSLDGKPFTADALKGYKPGSTVAMDVKRPTGKILSLGLTVGNDPALEAVTIESTGATATAVQRAFREAWLGSRVRAEVGVK